MRELAALGPVREHLALVASNLGDRYEAAAPPPAGQRLRRLGLRTAPGGQPGGLPAAPVNPVVVRPTPAAAGPGRAAISTIHAIDQDGSFPGVTALLVRPDGYVAWAGDSEDGLDQAIGKLLRTEGRKESARV
ncbi:MAG TPA: hypothetical protein VH478_21960 [Trebonia sp.]|nr:hypothetical protein [Trebonia sp.]